MNEYLRKEVGLLHGYNHITYKRFADEIGVKEDTISKWTRRKFNFSRKRTRFKRIYNLENLHIHHNTSQENLLRFSSRKDVMSRR